MNTKISNSVVTTMGYTSAGSSGGAQLLTGISGNGVYGYIEDDKEFLFLEIKKALTIIFNNIDFNQKTEQIEIRDLQNVLNLVGSILNK